MRQCAWRSQLPDAAAAKMRLVSTGETAYLAPEEEAHCVVDATCRQASCIRKLSARRPLCDLVYVKPVRVVPSRY